VAFALLFGLVVGGNSTLEALIWADYYGRVALGTIRGFGRPFILAANALGPLVAGMLVDALGSYQVAYASFAATSLAAAVLVLTARPPRRARPAAAPAMPQV
jgi:sugar phosphate permease